jgi:hypothetical protein
MGIADKVSVHFRRVLRPVSITGISTGEILQCLTWHDSSPQG